MPNYVLVLSAINIIDSNGQLVGQTPYPPDSPVFRPYNATSVQALRCGLSMEEGSLPVDPQTKLPVQGVSFTASYTRYILDDPQYVTDAFGGSWWTYILSNVRPFTSLFAWTLFHIF